MSDELHRYPGNLKHHKVDAPAKREPLLSRDRYVEYSEQYTFPTRREVLRGLEKFGDAYEAARAKDAELIQRLVDALWSSIPTVTNQWNMALDAAAAAGFKPSEQ